MDLSLVLACYRDAPHLERNVAVLNAYLASTRLAYEIIFVEDASPDDTLAAVHRSAAALRAQAVTTQVIEHPTNTGRGGAVQDGFLAARGDVVAFIDVDLEHRPDAMLSMYLRIASGECDGVVANRLYEVSRVNPLRMILSRGYRFLLKSCIELPVSDTEAGFKMFKRARILPVLPTVEDRGWFWDTEIVARAADAGLRLIDHPIIFVRDATKQSTVRIVRDSLEYLLKLTSFLRQRRRVQLAEATAQVRV
jgi:glycosyltransferase involved in cell wall biosynthesis